MSQEPGACTTHRQHVQILTPTPCNSLNEQEAEGELTVQIRSFRDERQTLVSKERKREKRIKGFHIYRIASTIVEPERKLLISQL